MKLNVSTLGTRSLTYEILFITTGRGSLRYIRKLAMTDFWLRFYNIFDRSSTFQLGNTEYLREIRLDLIPRAPDNLPNRSDQLKNYASLKPSRERQLGLSFIIDPVAGNDED